MKRKQFKLNKDDILEIVTEALAHDHGFGTFSARADLIVEDGEVYFVGVIGEEDDRGVSQVNLDALYTEIEYNGTHEHTEGCDREALLQAIERAISTGEY